MRGLIPWNAAVFTSPAWIDRAAVRVDRQIRTGRIEVRVVVDVDVVVPHADVHDEVIVFDLVLDVPRCKHRMARAEEPALIRLIPPDVVAVVVDTGVDQDLFTGDLVRIVVCKCIVRGHETGQREDTLIPPGIIADGVALEVSADLDRMRSTDLGDVRTVHAQILAAEFGIGSQHIAGSVERKIIQDLPGRPEVAAGLPAGDIVRRSGSRPIPHSHSPRCRRSAGNHPADTDPIASASEWKYPSVTS